MNERIQKLIEQATTIEYGVDNGFDRAFFDKVRFAELIVRECSQMVVNSHPDDLPFVGGKMLVHFGVSE